MSPAALALLADLADGYRVEHDPSEGWDTGDVHLRKSKRLDHAALSELRNAGFLDFAANGSGNAWINEAGRKCHAEGDRT